MATRQWTVIDVATQTYLDELAIGPDAVSGATRGYSVTKRTLRSGLCDGVEWCMSPTAYFGQPILGAGSRVVAPVKTVVPRNALAAEGIADWDSYAAEATGYEEQVYFLELLGARDGTSRALLKNAQGTRGVGMHFNLRQLPCYTLWKNTASAAAITALQAGVEPKVYDKPQEGWCAP
jgi:hypothetical protein